MPGKNYSKFGLFPVIFSLIIFVRTAFASKPQPPPLASWESSHQIFGHFWHGWLSEQRFSESRKKQQFFGIKVGGPPRLVKHLVGPFSQGSTVSLKPQKWWWGSPPPPSWWMRGDSRPLLFVQRCRCFNLSFGFASEGHFPRAMLW